MLLHPWDFPGKSTGVGCHFLLQCPHPNPVSQDLSWGKTNAEKVTPGKTQGFFSQSESVRAELSPQQALPELGVGARKRREFRESLAWAGLYRHRHEEARGGAMQSRRLSICTHGLQPRSKESRRLFTTHRASLSHWGQMKTSEGRQCLQVLEQEKARDKTGTGWMSGNWGTGLQWGCVTSPESSGLTLNLSPSPLKAPSFQREWAQPTPQWHQKEPTSADSGSEIPPMLPPPISKNCTFQLRSRRPGWWV